MEAVRKKKLLNIAELLVIIALAVFMIVLLAAGSSRDVPMEDIRQAMASLPGMEGLLPKNDTGIKAAYGVVPSGYLYYRSDEVMDVRELLIVKVRDDSEMEQMEDAAAEHLATQIDNYTGYGTNQVDLLQHAITTEKGDYFFAAVGEQAEEWQTAFLRIVG